jgi:hypothetical protein
MDKIRLVDQKKIKLKPKCYDESRAIFSLSHFNDLKNDFVESFFELLKNNDSADNTICDYDILQTSRNNCEAYKELVYLISQLSLIDTMKERYANTCDYEELAIREYINKSSTQPYPTTSLKRHLRVVAVFIEEQLDRYPELYKHLDRYMRNIA